MLTRHDLFFLLAAQPQKLDPGRLLAACLACAREPDSDLPAMLLPGERLPIGSVDNCSDWRFDRNGRSGRGGAANGADEQLHAEKGDV